MSNINKKKRKKLESNLYNVINKFNRTLAKLEITTRMFINLDSPEKTWDYYSKCRKQREL